MAGRHFLDPRAEPPAASPTGEPTSARLLELLEEQVVARFARLSKTDLESVALLVAEANEEDPAPNPSHPACAEFASSDYCRESWQLHLAKLKHRPEAHWGTCQHERLCAIIPVVCDHRCLAVVKLAGPASIEESEVRRLVEIIELLVRDFAASHSAFLRRVPGGLTVRSNQEPLHGSEPGRAAKPLLANPQVLRALEYIAAYLSDPHLTVARVASELDLCPNYLGEIFVVHMGQRMSRFIANRRIENAKRLLATTDWQIKRVALQTGHANPNWFCHVFSAHTGLTPSEYRAAARAGHQGRADR